MRDSVWSAQDTTPTAIELALREMLSERHAEHEGFVPARVLSLVCVVERDWRGEIANRLRQVGSNHASRTIICAVERGRTRIDAVATIASEEEPGADQVALTRETVVLSIGSEHLPHLDTIIDPLVITDLPTVVWAPHGHTEAVQALRRLAQVVLLDTIDDPDAGEGIARARRLADSMHVVDMAWLRTAPWRERLAATFDPPARRPELSVISHVEVRHQIDSVASGLLLVGWLASRLNWRCGPLVKGSTGLRGSAHARRQDVVIELKPAPEMTVRGLEGVCLRTASGSEVSFARGAGGLRAHRRERRGDRERHWTVLGASRGEGGILGAAIRAALARDRVYLPALEMAAEMA